MDEKRYIEYRKKYLKKVTKLFYEREGINQEMRRLKKEMAAYDKTLVNEDD